MRRHECADLLERLAADGGYPGVGGRVADHQDQVRPLVGRASEDLVQESHRARGVGQRRQAGVVGCGDQHAGGDADRFQRVVVLDAAAAAAAAVHLGKNDDQIGRGFEKRLLLVGSERRQSFEPVRRHPLV